MNKFTFTMEGLDGFKNTLQFEADTWDEALENFTVFLRGCGYIFEGEFVKTDPAMEDSFYEAWGGTFQDDEVFLDEEDLIILEDGNTFDNMGSSMQDERWPFTSEQK